MAEEAPDGIKASISPIDVKKEPNPLDGLDLSMSPSMAFKRPLEQFSGQTMENEHEAKRLKTDDHQEEEELPFEFDVSLLVQNALSNFSNELSGHSNQDADVVPTTEPMHTGEMMSFNSPPVVEGPPPPPEPAPASFISDPERYLRESQLHALASMALSVLIIATHQPLDDMITRIQITEFDHGRHLRRLKQGLEATKNMYSPDPVLNSDQIGMHDPDAPTILQLANIAQLGAWIMDGSIESMRQGDKYLLPMLQDSEGGLSKSAIDTWTGIKTHLAVDSLIGKPDELSSEQILRQFFTESVKQRLAERPSHLQFKEERANEIASALKIRQDELQELTQTEGGLASARDRYAVYDILKPFSVHARDQLSMATHIAQKLGITLPVNDAVEHAVNNVVNDVVNDAVNNAVNNAVNEIPQEPIPETSEAVVNLNMDDLDNLGLDDLFEKQTSGLVESALASFLAQANEAEEPLANLTNGNTNTEQIQETSTADTSKPGEFATPHINGSSLMTDYKELEALVAESTSNYVRTTLQGLSPAPYQPVVPASTADSMAAQSNYLTHLQHHNGHNPYYSSFPHGMQEAQPEQPSSETLPPNQTASSSDLYDKARQAALSKTTSHTRREGSHSTRRPWSQEEEKALMAGLDMVKGPHWSQILTLFGANGTISDILKDRTQVQLKDKARNLKLFFLKTNSEMPFYLQAVTGELKTRAPTQAARKEAEERARLNSEEDQAKLQGIMALAGGLQHPPQKRTSGSPVAAAGSTASPGQASHSQGMNASQHSHTHAHPQMQSTAYQSTTAEAAQSRPGVQATTQKTLQSIAQPPPRPQNQFPPQVPRPQVPRPQSHPHPHSQSQPRPQQHHIASSQGTQGVNQRPGQQNGVPPQGVQQGLPQGSQQSQQPNQQQPTHNAVQHAVQPQNQQRMALPAQTASSRSPLPQNANIAVAGAAPASTANTQASAAPSTSYAQQQRPQQQQGQPQLQSSVSSATQPTTAAAQAQTQSPAFHHTATPVQSVTPASSGTATPATAAAQTHQHTAQSPQVGQLARAPSQPANPAQASSSPSQAHATTQPAASRPAQQAQPSTSPAVSDQQTQPNQATQQSQAQPLHFPQPVQPTQTSLPAQPIQAAQQSPGSQSNQQMQPTEAVQPSESTPPEQGQAIQHGEENHADDSEMSPEARLLKGLQDALAGASSMDSFGNGLG